MSSESLSFAKEVPEITKSSKTIKEYKNHLNDYNYYIEIELEIFSLLRISGSIPIRGSNWKEFRVDACFCLFLGLG